MDDGVRRKCGNFQGVRVKIVLVVESSGAEDERWEDGAERWAEGCGESTLGVEFLLGSHSIARCCTVTAAILWTCC